MESKSVVRKCLYLNSELVRGVGPSQHGELESLRPRLGAPHVGCADPEHLLGREVEAGQPLLLSVFAGPVLCNDNTVNIL